MKKQSVKNTLGCVLSLAFLTCISGCFTNHPVHLLVNSVEVYSPKGDTCQIADVAVMGKPVKMTASFIWDSPGGAGFHSVRWELYKGDQCIRKDPEKMLSFAHSPHMVFLWLDTTALGEGVFRGVLYVDEVVVATNSLTVKRE